MLTTLSMGLAMMLNAQKIDFLGNEGDTAMRRSMEFVTYT
jgi:hypothetical protein